MLRAPTSNVGHDKIATPGGSTALRELLVPPQTESASGGNFGGNSEDRIAENAIVAETCAENSSVPLPKTPLRPAIRLPVASNSALTGSAARCVAPRLA